MCYCHLLPGLVQMPDCSRSEERLHSLGTYMELRNRWMNHQFCWRLDASPDPELDIHFFFVDKLVTSGTCFLSALPSWKKKNNKMNRASTQNITSYKNVGMGKNYGNPPNYYLKVMYSKYMQLRGLHDISNKRQPSFQIWWWSVTECSVILKQHLPGTEKKNTRTCIMTVDHLKWLECTIITPVLSTS